MEANKIQLKSIWGTWWEPIRKWFYPAWLGYETSIRFYDYALSSYSFVRTYENYFGAFGIEVLAVLAAILTFVICFVFLTIPASIALFKFFKPEETYRITFEMKIKKYL
ncbi:hypothetical protein SAMN04489761_2917 [Tenacibaculum sp. MAR_2009_124]|uniref:hypothetical protein n=1 Tax=Tenacibaculum sp. MAR_2009_124 TaxID=1250059 RepID=UPI00089CCA09|nr:hypothetical protein [Tenacibaculum sp. MAR_2009_124]SEC41062.1 hypothetical protein SAMN04489761_2917 [Tenacibaculum sp. MAR_2009_124]